MTNLWQTGGWGEKPACTFDDQRIRVHFWEGDGNYGGPEVKGAHNVER